LFRRFDAQTGTRDKVGQRLGEGEIRQGIFDCADVIGLGEKERRGLGEAARKWKRRERTWMSSWRRWYGSSVIESFCPEQRRTDRSWPPKIFVMGDSRVSVYSQRDN
jgi:hypothetical protein